MWIRRAPQSRAAISCRARSFSSVSILGLRPCALSLSSPPKQKPTLPSLSKQRLHLSHLERAEKHHPIGKAQRQRDGFSAFELGRLAQHGDASGGHGGVAARPEQTIEVEARHVAIERAL